MKRLYALILLSASAIGFGTGANRVTDCQAWNSLTFATTQSSDMKSIGAEAFTHCNLTGDDCRYTIKLTIKQNGTEITGSPFTSTQYIRSCNSGSAGDYHDTYYKTGLAAGTYSVTGKIYDRNNVEKDQDGPTSYTIP